MRIFLAVFAALLVLCSCVDRSSSRGTDSVGENTADSTFTSYASGFRVFERGNHRMVQVLDPWQQSQNVIFSYVLAHEGEVLSDSLKRLSVIRTPVRRVIALSTTHVAMIEQLGCGASVVGLSGSEFIYSEHIRDRIKSGEAEDVGYGQGIDYESIVRLRPDLVFLYGVEGNVMTTLEKLSELGIPAVFCGEYLETHPLGKAEWISFFSLFYEREAEAAHFFQQVDSAYCELAELASGIETRPKILTGLPWKDTWYMAGGKSFAARLMADAGGSFLWSDNTSTQALPMDLESVYLRAVEADIWINPGAAVNVDGIVQLDERFGALEVLKNGQIYNNNARINEAGGNDYWESGTVRPDQILADLIEVFHPGLLTDHSYVYYRQLK